MNNVTSHFTQLNEISEGSAVPVYRLHFLLGKKQKLKMRHISQRLTNNESNQTDQNKIVGSCHCNFKLWVINCFLTYAF